MRFGLEIIPFGEFADPQLFARLAQTAEQAGWEGIWVWDHLLMPFDVGDPWVLLCAAASATTRLKLVTGVAAIPRYHPHLLARMSTTLDHLSSGRFILGAGSGGQEGEFTAFGQPGDARVRAEMLDEGLEVLTRLWSGQPLDHHGKYYTVDNVGLAMTPVQKPWPPIWIGGESRKALQRAAKWDGWIIGVIDENAQIIHPPEEIARSVEMIRSQQEIKVPFDVAVDGVSEPGKTENIWAYAQAGATWYFEAIYGLRGSVDEMLDRIQAGPPVV